MAAYLRPAAIAWFCQSAVGPPGPGVGRPPRSKSLLSQDARVGRGRSRAHGRARACASGSPSISSSRRSRSRSR
eukprot:2618567-Lingulodinium_polyedra.AAC.1